MQRAWTLNIYGHQNKKNWVKIVDNMVEQYEGIHEIGPLLTLEQPTKIQLRVFFVPLDHWPCEFRSVQLSDTEIRPGNP